MSDTSTPTPSAPNDGGESLEQLLDRTSGGETAPPSEPSPAASEPSAEPPVPTPEESWNLTLKEDGKEEAIDLKAYYADEAKRAELVGWLQKGRQFDKLAERTRRTGQQEAIDHLAGLGYEFARDPSTGRFLPRTKTPDANAAGRPAAEAPPSDPKPLEAELALIRKRISDDEATNKDFARALELQEQIRDVKLAQSFTAERARLETLEKSRQRDEAMTRQQAEQRQASIATSMTSRVREFTKGKPAFLGLSDADIDEYVANAVIDDAARAAYARLDEAGVWSAVEAGLKKWESRENRRYAERLRAQAVPSGGAASSNGNGQRPTSPTGGVPPSSGGGDLRSRLSKMTSMDDMTEEDWARV